MGAKLLVAFLLIALGIVFFKFMREREARLRERAALAERLAAARHKGNADPRQSAGEKGPTLDMRPDPETGVFRPADSDAGEATEETGRDRSPGD